MYSTDGSELVDYFGAFEGRLRVNSGYIQDSVNDATAQCLCLDVVSAYVDWIDLELVANDVFVPIVIARLANKETLEVCFFLPFHYKLNAFKSAIRAITGLIQKGMPPNKKLSLLLALGNVIRSNQLLSITPVFYISCMLQYLIFCEGKRF